MDDRRIVEQDSHAELLSRHGFSYDLYNSQFTEAPVKTQQTLRQVRWAVVLSSC